MPSVAVIGCGGIGSYFAANLREMVNKGQLPLRDKYTFIDFDIVEPKNLLYQNFIDGDLAKPKAECIALRYGFMLKNEKITDDMQLEPFDKFIICADNAAVRELCYRHCFSKKKFFLDLRCRGRMNAYLVNKGQKLKNLLKTLPEDAGSGSCQVEQRLDKNQIDVCNRIIAWKGIQILLNIERGIETEDYYPENV